MTLKTQYLFFSITQIQIILENIIMLKTIFFELRIYGVEMHLNYL